MTSKELLKEIESWLSFNTEPSKEEVAKLRKSIKDHLAEQLPIHKVSKRDFIVGDVVCTQDGMIWIIKEINGNNLLVVGNGRENYPLEKYDVSHLR